MRNPEAILDLMSDLATERDIADANAASMSTQLQLLTAAIASEPELTQTGSPCAAAAAVIRRLQAQLQAFLTGRNGKESS